MKLERDVIIDLLPAYFSGEASAATRALVEEYFRDNPDFERSARGANQPLERLKVTTVSPDQEREKLALERARQVTETRSSFLWLAVCFTLMLLLPRIHDGNVSLLLFDKDAIVGNLFAAMAAFFWLFFFYVRRRKDPLPMDTKFLWLAVFYTLMLFTFRVHNHKLVLVFFSPEPTVGLVFSCIAVILWINYFYQRWKARRAEA